MADFEELAEIIRTRQSVRSFQSDPVPENAIRRAIDLAGWAPSPHGTQPWRFVVLESLHERTSLADVMAETWREQLTQDGAPQSEIERRAMRSQERLVTAPVVVILCLDLSRAHVYDDEERNRAEYLMAVHSLGAAAQNFLLGIHMQGLSSGWMCAPLFVPELIRTHLQLDESLIPHAMFPVGYMQSPPKRRPRISVDDLIVQWRN